MPWQAVLFSTWETLKISLPSAEHGFYAWGFAHSRQEFQMSAHVPGDSWASETSAWLQHRGCGAVANQTTEAPQGAPTVCRINISSPRLPRRKLLPIFVYFFAILIGWGLTLAHRLRIDSPRRVCGVGQPMYKSAHRLCRLPVTRYHSMLFHSSSDLLYVFHIANKDVTPPSRT